MDAIHKLLLFVLGLSSIVFISLFGRLPTFRNTPIGFLYRLFCVHTPRLLYALDLQLTGARVSKGCSHLGHFLLFEQHPLVLIGFLALLTSAASAFLYKAWPLLSTPHHIIVPPLLIAPYLATYLCATSTNSYITRPNHGQHLRAYPYDHTLYHPRIPCRTCVFAKPARSKHCSICRVCVARADHHCAWVNNCIGRDNYASFLALVASLAVLLVYGTVLALALLSPRVPKIQDEPLRAWLVRWANTIASDPMLGGVGLLAALTSPLALGFLAYHIYLIWAGMTTNETDKWGALRDAMSAGKVWRGSRAAVLGGGSVPNDAKVAHGARLFASAETQKWAAPPLTPLFERDEEEAAESSGSDADSLAGADGPAARAVRDAEDRWPTTSDQIVVRTRDGKAPVMLGRRVRGPSPSARGWTQVWRLEQIENLYDLGFWRNLKEAVAPGPLPQF